MKYPNFYNDVKTIKLKDSLSELLGAFENGIIEFTYLDIVKSAGHSCATVAGAYLTTLKSLQYLYPDSLPARGEIKVEFQDDENSGVTGVIANVIENITGATTNRGFKGIGGNFARHSLMEFNAKIEGQIKFTRTDTGQSVEAVYNPVVPPHERQQILMQKIMMQQANLSDKTEFANIWQNRVKEILIDLDIDEIQNVVNEALKEELSAEKILDSLCEGMLKVGKLYEEKIADVRFVPMTGEVERQGD